MHHINAEMNCTHPHSGFVPALPRADDTMNRKTENEKLHYGKGLP